MRTPMILAGVLALLTVGSGGVIAQEASAPPPSPAVTPIASPYDDSMAIPLAPMPGGIVEPQPIGWDHVTIWPDGRTLTIYFWNGPEPCFGLDRVELADVDSALSITPWVGFRADAADKRCTADLVLQSTVVQLATPVLGGGTPRPSWADRPGHASGTLIEPGAALSEELPTPWDRINVAPDGATLMVDFSGGVPECFGLDRVDTPVVDGVVDIMIRYGRLADLPEVCILPARAYWTPVVLETPLLLGGAA